MFGAHNPVTLSDDWVNPDLKQDQQEHEQWTQQLLQ